MNQKPADWASRHALRVWDTYTRQDASGLDGLDSQRLTFESQCPILFVSPR